MVDPIHVVPVSDIKEHEESPNCWCSPEHELGDEPGHADLYVHNAADGRERYEATKQ